MNPDQKRRSITVFVVFCVAAFFTPAVAGAFPPGMARCEKPEAGAHMPPPPIWQDPKVIEELELTSAQIKALKDADFAFREKRLEQKAQCDLLQLKLEKALSEDQAEEKSVRKMAQNLADLKGKVFVQDIMFRLEIDKILTSEQRIELRSLKAGDRPRCKPHPGNSDALWPGFP